MIRLQRLFGNGYTEPPRLPSQMGRGGLRSIGGVLAVLGFAALLAVPGGALAQSAAPAAAPFDRYNTGSVEVVLPDALPTVDLVQDANASVSASLTLVKIVELRDAVGNASEPTVVAAAFESKVASFNRTSTPGGDTVVALVANLTVYRDSGPLFPLADSDVPNLPLVAIAPTTVSLTVVSSPVEGVVNLTATIQNWPWASPDDLLAIGWEFAVANASGFAGCAGDRPVGVPPSACGASAFAFGNSTWGWSGFDGVQGLVGPGPSAQLRWGPSATLSNGATLPLTSGAQRTSPTGLEVVYGAPAYGTTGVTFSLAYGLAVPLLPPTLLHGALAPYLVGGAAAAGLVGVAVLAARRRDRRLLGSL